VTNKEKTTADPCGMTNKEKTTADPYGMTNKGKDNSRSLRDDKQRKRQQQIPAG
jgi:hypothetical protein